MKEQELTKIIKAALSLEEGEIDPERVAKRVAAYIAMSEKMGQPVKPTTKTVKPINDLLLERLKEDITPTPYTPPKFVPPVTSPMLPVYPKEALKPYCLDLGNLGVNWKYNSLYLKRLANGEDVVEWPEEPKEEGEERLRTLMRKVELRELGLLKEE